jgi:hypothetical protein
MVIMALCQLLLIRLLSRLLVYHIGVLQRRDQRAHLLRPAAEALRPADSLCGHCSPKEFERAFSYGGSCSERNSIGKNTGHIVADSYGVRRNTASAIVGCTVGALRAAGAPRNKLIFVALAVLLLVILLVALRGSVLLATLVSVSLCLQQRLWPERALLRRELWQRRHHSRRECAVIRNNP